MADAPIQIPKGIESVAKALEDAKANKRPCVIFFWDGSRRNMMFEENILKSGQLGRDAYKMVSFVKLQFKKSSPEAKEYKVRSAPCVVIVDNTKEKPKVLKTVKSGSPLTLRKAILDAVKKMKK